MANVGEKSFECLCAYFVEVHRQIWEMLEGREKIHSSLVYGTILIDVILQKIPIAYCNPKQTISKTDVMM